jgi:hypothetical protein
VSWASAANTTLHCESGRSGSSAARLESASGFLCEKSLAELTRRLYLTLSETEHLVRLRVERADGVSSNVLEFSNSCPVPPTFEWLPPKGSALLEVKSLDEPFTLEFACANTNGATLWSKCGVAWQRLNVTVPSEGTLAIRGTARELVRRVTCHEYDDGGEGSAGHYEWKLGEATGLWHLDFAIDQTGYPRVEQRVEVVLHEETWREIVLDVALGVGWWLCVHTLVMTVGLVCRCWGAASRSESTRSKTPRRATARQQSQRSAALRGRSGY